MSPDPKSWLSKLYGEVGAWYYDRFGAAFEAAVEKGRDFRRPGIVSIDGTGFALRVPMARGRAGRPGGTVWINFPDGVREDQRPIEWIEPSPNLERLRPKEIEAAEFEAAEVAGYLRFIDTGVLSL